MKTPDKLYISHLIYDTFMYQTPDPDDATQVEYIRKDALLEWAYENFDPASYLQLKNKLEEM